MPIFLLLGVAMVVATIATRGPKKSTAPQHAASSTQQWELDRDMPSAVVDRVLSALAHGEDPAVLESLAREIGGKFPLSADELRAKASALRAAREGDTHAGALPPAPTGASPAPVPVLAVPPAANSIPAPAPRAPADAATVLQAAMRALAQERDPARLDGFARSIEMSFPAAAALLVMRARELRAGVLPVPAPPIVAPPAPQLGVPTVSTPVHTPTMPATYVVRAGESASTIAQKLVHDSRRWRELVVANPTKPTGGDGNFVALHVGEAILIPASWASPATATAAHAAPEVHA